MNPEYPTNHSPETPDSVDRPSQHPDSEQHPDDGQEPVEQSRADPPRIWIASLADYNNGRLHGAWIDADQDPEDLEQAVSGVLASSPEPGAEEWAIHDYDNFGPLELGEHESLEDISVLAQGIANHGPAFAAWADLVRDSRGQLDHDLLAEFQMYYRGHYDSPADWAEQLLTELGEPGIDQLPGLLQPYIQIDWQAMARDLESDGMAEVVDDPAGGVWVFDVP